MNIWNSRLCYIPAVLTALQSVQFCFCCRFRYHPQSTKEREERGLRVPGNDRNPIPKPPAPRVTTALWTGTKHTRRWMDGMWSEGHVFGPLRRRLYGGGQSRKVDRNVFHKRQLLPVLWDTTKRSKTHLPVFLWCWVVRTGRDGDGAWIMGALGPRRGLLKPWHMAKPSVSLVPWVVGETALRDLSFANLFLNRNKGLTSLAFHTAFKFTAVLSE